MFNIKDEMEKIKQAVYKANGAHANDHPMQYLVTAEALKMIENALQRAMNEQKEP